jgi:hypothetical protein
MQYMYIKILTESFVQKAFFVFEIFSFEVNAYMYVQKTIFLRCRLQRLSFFSLVAYSIKKSLAL